MFFRVNLAIPSNEVAAEILDTLLYNRFNFTIPSNPKQKINSVRESKNRTEFFDTDAILTQFWPKKGSKNCVGKKNGTICCVWKISKPQYIASVAARGKPQLNIYFFEILIYTLYILTSRFLSNSKPKNAHSMGKKQACFTLKLF